MIRSFIATLIYPDLERIEGDKEKRNVLLSAVVAEVNHVKKELMGVHFITTIVAGTCLTIWAFPAGGPFAGIFSCVAAAYSGYAFICAWRPSLRRTLWKVAQEHGYPICASCGYSMLGAAANTTDCPECGATYAPANSISESSPASDQL